MRPVMTAAALALAMAAGAQDMTAQQESLVRRTRLPTSDSC